MDDATAEFYARNAKVVAARYEAAPSSIARYFGVAFAAGSRVLDVGAGSGRDLALLRRGGFEAFGVEPVDALRVEALEHHPELMRCVTAQGDSALARPRAGRHTLWLPVWMHEKVSTCLEITQSRPFSAHKLDVIQGIFHVYQNYQSLLDYSERDALTGLLNRKTFDEQFSRSTADSLARRVRPATTGLAVDEEASCCEPPVEQWLAVVDVDHFKQVNDRFGHLYGDEVLILIANILRSSFRSHDRIFRFGGEEFVVLLRATSLATAHKVFNRFRLAVQEYPFPQVGQVTVSLGFVSTSRGAPVEILGQADQALYYAKENGRNQVCFYDELIASGQLKTKVANDDVELF